MKLGEWILNILTLGAYKEKQKELKQKESKIEEMLEEAEKKVNYLENSKTLVPIKIVKEDDENYIQSLQAIIDNKDFVYFVYSAQQELYEKLFVESIDKETAEEIRCMVRGIKFLNIKLLKAGKRWH